MFKREQKLDEIRKRVTQGSQKGNLVTAFYYLAKELHCLPELLGREFEVDYDKDGKIKRIRQLPISIPALVTLLGEMEEDYKGQEREARKAKGKR